MDVPASVHRLQFAHQSPASLPLDAATSGAAIGATSPPTVSVFMSTRYYVAAAQPDVVSMTVQSHGW
jgi:hypothetical protein